VTPDEEWAELVAPYDAAAAALGYRLLNSSRYVSYENPTLTLFNQTLFDGQATFLDFAATIVRGAPLPYVVTGFHHVQFLTRVLHEEPFWILTNGVPLVRGAEDLPLVLERHRRTLVNRRIDVPDPARPLEWRWEIMAAEEAEA
jgi:hypothetical protein